MTNSPSPKQQLQDIYQLIRQNNPQEARRQLQQFIKNNPPDADAFYISTFLTSDIQRRIHLCERALQINPNHGPVMQLLEKLQTELAESTAADSPPGFMDDIPAPVTRSQAAPTPKFTPAEPPPAPTPEPPAPTPFTDTWGEEQFKAAKAKPTSREKAPAQPNAALLFGLGLVLGLVLAGAAGAYAVSQVGTQPTAAPIVLVVTATELPELPTSPPIDTATSRPPTRTRPPTFTPIPTRTSSSAFKTPGGDASSNPDESSVPTLSVEAANTRLNELSLMIEDAEYSTSLDKMVLIASEPNALYIYDPETQTRQTVALGRKPTCISVSVDGKFAAVGHEGLVTYVDLTTATVVKTLEFSDTAYDLMLLSTGWVVVMPPNTYNTLYLFEVLTSQQSIVESDDIYPSGHLQRDANGSGVYVISTRLSPGGMDHVTFEDGKLAGLQNWDPLYTRRLHGETLEHCDNAWLASDNQRIFTRCGTIFQADPDPVQDMVPAGSLTEIGAADGVIFVPSQRKLVALGKSSARVNQGIPDWDAPQIIYTYDSDTLVLETSTTLPAFRAGYPGDGGYLFVNAAGTHYYALLGYQSYINDKHNRTKNRNSLFGIAVGTVGSGSAVAAQATPAMTNAPDNTSKGNVKSLPYQVFDAKFSSTLNRMIMIAKDDLTLHIYDPINDTEQQVALQRVPTSISISTDGNFALVGQDAMLSYVDLKTQSVVKTFDVPFKVTSTILANNGWAYLGGLNSSQRAISIGIELATGKQGNGAFGSIHPDGRIYSVGSDTLTVLDISDPANPITPLVPPQTYPTLAVKRCHPLWFTDDRKRIFTGCATVLRASPDPALDGEYTGKLDRLTSVSALAVSTVSGKVVAIGKLDSRETVIDTKLVIYNYDTLNVEDIVNLPALSGASNTHGKFVFIDADGKTYYVLAQSKDEDNFSLIHGEFDGVATGTVPPAVRTPVPNAETVIAPLDFAVSDAVYSKPLDRIIMTDAVSMKVIIYNPADGTKQLISLETVPIGLKLAPDSLSAVVTQPDRISLIDLQAATLLKTYTLGLKVQDAAIAPNGFIYAQVKPAPNDKNDAVVINIKTGTTIAYNVFTSSKGKLLIPSTGPYLYQMQLDGNNAGIYRMEMTQDGSLSDAVIWDDWENKATCWNAWLSDDNNRLFTRCGQLFKVSTDATQNLVYNGELKQSVYPKIRFMQYRWVIDSVPANIILALPDPDQLDWAEKPPEQKLLMFDSSSLQFLATISLPKIGPTDKLTGSVGQFVFVNAVGNQLYVILKAEDGSGLLNDYGIWSSPLKVN